MPYAQPADYSTAAISTVYAGSDFRPHCSLKRRLFSGRFPVVAAPSERSIWLEVGSKMTRVSLVNFLFFCFIIVFFPKLTSKCLQFAYGLREIRDQRMGIDRIQRREGLIS